MGRLYLSLGISLSDPFISHAIESAVPKQDIVVGLLPRHSDYRAKEWNQSLKRKGLSRVLSIMEQQSQGHIENGDCACNDSAMYRHGVWARMERDTWCDNTGVPAS
jgi:hypothetical protein